MKNLGKIKVEELDGLLNFNMINNININIVGIGGNVVGILGNFFMN